jgi:uncharacterized membrane protein
MNYLTTFIISFVLLTGLDFTFLGYFMSDFYKRSISPAATIEFSFLPAFLFYFLYLVGIFFFVVTPNLGENNLWKIVLAGALFGFMCYMTYDLTNLATLKNWPIKLVLVDIVWGTFITTLVSVVAYKLLS